MINIFHGHQQKLELAAFEKLISMKLIFLLRFTAHFLHSSTAIVRVKLTNSHYSPVNVHYHLCNKFIHSTRFSLSLSHNARHTKEQFNFDFLSAKVN